MKRKSVRSQIKDQTEESVVTLGRNKKQFWASPGGPDVQNMPSMQEIWI